MEERFDVVDEHDRPTGELTTKAEAHASGIPHRLVAVYAFDTDGNLLVQLHKASKMFDHSVGGHVSAGEDYQAAVERESAEELGLVNEKLEEVYLGLYSDEFFNPDVQVANQVHLFGIYECHPSPDWRFVANDEVDTIVPMSLEKVVGMLHENPGEFTPGIVNTMAKYLELRRPDLAYDVEAVRASWRRG